MPHLKRLHTARGYLLASYIILSALNFVSAATGYHGIIDRTITLVVSSYQALLITATFIVFIRPNAISQRTIIIHFACITIYSFLLIASILWYPGLYSVAMWLAVTVYTFQLAFYTWWFEKAYKLSVKDVENFYDEDEEARLRWVKKGFYIMLGCGVTALIGLFFNGLYMLLFNILVVVCYTYLASAVQRYMYRMGFLMPVIAEEDKNSRQVNFNSSIIIKNSLENLSVSFDLSAPEDLTLQNQLSSLTAEQRASQAMSLLIYNTYTGPGTSTTKADLLGNPLNSFLQKELNEWANNLKGIDLSFDINSYTDASGINTRTDYSYRAAKSLFNNRVKVVIGGSLSPDDNADVNFKENFIDDISLEYYLNQRDNMYIKVFRHTGYESILEGEITQTGVGFVVKKRLLNLSELFRSSKKRKEPAQ